MSCEQVLDFLTRKFSTVYYTKIRRIISCQNITPCSHGYMNCIIDYHNVYIL